jgi:hypothetical protein
LGLSAILIFFGVVCSEKNVSGAQARVECAALDAARAFGIEHGGWWGVSSPYLIVRFDERISPTLQWHKKNSLEIHKTHNIAGPWASAHSLIVCADI